MSGNIRDNSTFILRSAARVVLCNCITILLKKSAIHDMYVLFCFVYPRPRYDKIMHSDTNVLLYPSIVQMTAPSWTVKL